MTRFTLCYLLKDAIAQVRIVVEPVNRKTRSLLLGLELLWSPQKFQLYDATQKLYQMPVSELSRK
ncbi:hypothetical protein [Phormidesmis priestleyi]|uniref:hypothetical protein n=1 Tax=Phormidesmis priestleyi TaxID=268141 RepID=UPI000AEC8C2E|nr:hypothetical protein [Phormidesmis priestleyi]